MRIPPWLLLAMIVVTGVYVMPSVVAKFAGSHTMEANKTASASGMNCGNCHAWIVDEINASSVATPVLDAHIAARANVLYANTTGGEVNIPLNNSPVTKSNVCALCHQAQTSVSGTHTRVVTRVCTDPACHGDSQVYGSNHTYPNAGYVGMNISKANDSHSAWFNGLEGYASNRPIEFVPGADTGTEPAEASDYNAMSQDTGNYTAAYYACLGCHTHTGMRFKLTRPSYINMTMSYATGEWVVSEASVNMTNTNDTVVTRTYGSVW